MSRSSASENTIRAYPWVPFGNHLDDWLGSDDFVLAGAVLLGYPPIPFATAPYLVAARAEVNAQVDLRGSQHVHFVLSATPRGGFSGGERRSSMASRSASTGS